LLVIPPGGSEVFETTHFSINIVGFDVEVHAFFGCLGVLSELEQNAKVGVRQPQATVDAAATFAQLLFLGVERGRPECDASIQIVYIDDEMAESAAVRHTLRILTNTQMVASCLDDGPTTAAAFLLLTSGVEPSGLPGLRRC
jgi:hypothetical protein